MFNPSVRLGKEQRAKLILKSAYVLAKSGSLMTMSLRNVVDCMDVTCSTSTIKHYFGSLKGLRNAVIEEAIIRDNHKILAVAIANHEPATEKMSGVQRSAALKSLK